mmetsp:Transcript_2598/g.2170  ORF Transcript_2598/g.2170 Transcript_2598/m.2170 type:complete len:175 (-) Transcript_2598:150-674(-)
MRHKQQHRCRENRTNYVSRWHLLPMSICTDRHGTTEGFSGAVPTSRCTIAAIKKAVELARDGDMISCVHVPRPFPEYLLSSMNDPGAVSAEGEALFFGGYLKSLFEATGPSIITKVRKEVEDLAVEKNLQTEYKLLSPSNNVKVELVAHCRTTGADYVVVGPGKDCSGRIIHTR